MEARKELVRNFNEKKAIVGVHTILTHPSYHLDEFGAYYLLSKTPEGVRQFPGIENAGIGSITETQLREKGYCGFYGFIKALEAGYLIIGIGNGPFDEHQNRETKVSCTELIKRYLDLYKDKDNRTVYGELIKFINHEDNNGDNLIKNLNKVNPRKLERAEIDTLNNLNVGMIAQSIKKGWELVETKEDEQRLVNRTIWFIHDEVCHSKKFLQVQKELSSTTKEIIKLKDEIGMIIVNNDHSMIARAVNSIATLPGGLKRGLTFIVKSNGQFFLSPSKELKMFMSDIASTLKIRSRTKNNEIYLDENTGNIMNGSKTDPEVSGLINNGLTVKIIIEVIQQIIK